LISGTASLAACLSTTPRACAWAMQNVSLDRVFGITIAAASLGLNGRSKKATAPPN
jgi:hypothetical protein